MQSLRDDGLLVACKAAELMWETTAAVLECRYSTGSLGAAELAGKAPICVHFDGKCAAQPALADARRLRHRVS